LNDRLQALVQLHAQSHRGDPPRCDSETWAEALSRDVLAARYQATDRQDREAHRPAYRPKADETFDQKASKAAGEWC
jgi:hypothetical protein